MMLRRIVSLVMAIALLFALSAAAGADTAVVNSWKVENAYVTMNERTGALAIQDRATGLFTLCAPDGTALTTEPYIHMDTADTMFEVALQSGLNVFGLIDSNGQVMVPPQYGDTIYLSDRWQMGVVLTEATSENYDYKSFDGKSFYLISGYDVYYQGAKVGTLDRLAYRNAYAYGAYLYVVDEQKNYVCYDSTLTASAYVPGFAGSREYDDTRDGIFHKGSGQQVGVPGCTLTSDDVENDIFLIDGRFVDLQGNELFAADAKYENYYDFEGDYARVRMNGKYGLVDRTGREVLSCEYDEISYNNDSYFNGGYQIVIKDGKVGFVNPDGEVTCEFKYSENSVKSTYKMPLTHLADLDGSLIVLSGAVGELEQRFVEVDISNYGCPLFSGEPEDKKAGVYDLYGNAVIPADGQYDDVYDLQISDDGSVVVGYGTDRSYTVYQIGTAAQAPAEQSVDAPAVGGALIGDTAAQQSEQQTETPAADGSWTCSQGHANSGKFCSECGEAKPADKLVCAKCGYEPEEGASPKFCSECGNAF